MSVTWECYFISFSYLIWLWLEDCHKNQPQAVYGGNEMDDDIKSRLNSAILLNASMDWWSCSIHIQTNASKDFLLKYKITITMLIVSNIQNIFVTHCWPNSVSWYPTKISAMNISRYENHFWNTGPLWGNPPVTGGFPHKWPVCGDFVFSSMLAWTSFQPKQYFLSWIEVHLIDLKHLVLYLMGFKC